MEPKQKPKTHTLKSLSLAASVLILFFILLSSTAAALSDSEVQEILDAHNKYRMEVGVPQLTWDDNLAVSAQNWADHLAATDTLEHSGPGENLYMSSTNDSWTIAIDSWAAEKQCFKNGIFPDIYNGQCDSNCAAMDWTCAGHYSQIIWKDTQKVGGGKAFNSESGNFYYVCQYSPAGNVVGQNAF